MALLFFKENMVKYALILDIHMHNITIFVTRHLSSGLTNLLKHLLKGHSLVDLLAIESEVKHSAVKSKTKLDDQNKLRSGSDRFVAILGKKTPLSHSSSCSLPASLDIEYRPASYIHPTACPTQHPALLKSIRYSCLL